MSNLPRTRPQRDTGRRNRAGAASQGTTAARPKSRPAATARATKQPTPKRATAAAARRQPSRAKPVRSAEPVVRTTPPPQPAARRARSSQAPSLPRLAVDGAVEAAKLPLRVGGRLTLRALDAVARGLRGS